MGIIVRQSVQNTIISYFGVALGFIVTMWMYPNILTPEQYGLTRVLLSLAMVSTQLANLGTKNTIVRFFPFFRDQENKHHGLLFLSLAVPMGGFILLGGLLYFFQPTIIEYFIDRSALFVDYYWFILPLAFFILFFHVLSSFVRALYDTVMSSFLNNVVVRILTVLILAAYLFGWINFQEFMIFFVLSYAAVMVSLFIYTLSMFDVDLKPEWGYLKKSLAQNMMNYSLFAFFGGIASIVVSNIDIIMLSSLAGLEDTGIYAIAFYIGSAITIPRKSIYQISSPLIADAFKAKNFTLIEDIYHRSSLTQIIAGGLLFCGIIANLDNLMNILPPEYAGGSLVIIVVGAANVFDMATGLNGAIILNSKHYRFDLYSTLFLILVTVTLNYLLIPIYGILGAAIGTATAVLTYNSLKVLYVWLKLSMQPFESKMVYVIASGAVTILLVNQIPTIGGIYSDILIRSIIVTLLYGVPIWLMNISEDLNNLIANTITQIASFFKSNT